MENGTLTNIVNTVDGKGFVYDVWQMECNADNMTDDKAACADDTTEYLLGVQ